MPPPLSLSYRRKVITSCGYCVVGLLLALALPLAAEANRERSNAAQGPGKRPAATRVEVPHAAGATSELPPGLPPRLPPAYALVRGQSEGQED